MQYFLLSIIFLPLYQDSESYALSIPSHSLLGEVQKIPKNIGVGAQFYRTHWKEAFCFLALPLKPSPAPVTCHCSSTSLLWHNQTQTLPLKHLPKTLRPFSPNHSKIPNSFSV